jgi:hypothetical protein
MTKKSKIIVKKAPATKKRPAHTKIVVHDPEPVLEVVVHDEAIAHDPTFLERIQTWLTENFS